MNALAEKELTIADDREAFFEVLYKAAFPKAAHFVRKMNGTLSDARDIFHDALVIFYEKIRDEEVTFQASPEAYLLGISKHLWLKKHRRDSDKVALDALEREIAIPPDYFASDTDHQLLHIVKQAGKKCLDMLQAFYYQKLSMKNIAARFRYASERSATVQKYKCLEKIRNHVKQNGISYEEVTP